MPALPSSQDIRVLATVLHHLDDRCARIPTINPVSEDSVAGLVEAGPASFAPLTVFANRAGLSHCTCLLVVSLAKVGFPRIARLLTEGLPALAVPSVVNELLDQPAIGPDLVAEGAAPIDPEDLAVAFSCLRWLDHELAFGSEVDVAEGPPASQIRPIVDGHLSCFPDFCIVANVHGFPFLTSLLAQAFRTCGADAFANLCQATDEIREQDHRGH